MADFNDVSTFVPKTPTGLNPLVSEQAQTLGMSGDALAAAKGLNVTNELPTNKPSSGSHFQAHAKPIPQSERLFTVRPRSTGYNKVDNRGPIARMRILPLDRGAFPTEAPKDLFSTSDTTGWNQFFLTDVQCQMSEKAQVLEVFGDNHVAYYFGKSPTMFTLSGLVFDSIDGDWFTGLVDTYENFIRGSKLAKNYALLEIILPNIKIIGSVMSLNYNQNSQRDTDIQFSMQILAKAVDMIPLSIPEVDQESLLNVVKWPTAIGNLPREALNASKTYANLQSFIQSPVSSSMDILGMAGNLKKAFSPLTDALNFSQAGSITGVPGLSTMIGSVGGPVSSAIGGLTGFASANGLTMDQGVLDSTKADFAKLGISFDPSYGTCSPGMTPDFSSLASTALKGLSDLPNNPGDTSNIPSPDNSYMGITSSPAVEGYWSNAGLAQKNVTLGGISSTITGFKSGLFSPVYGFLSSITKIVTSVTGDIGKVLSSFTDPVNSVLRDINGISREIMSITGLITSSVGQLIGIPRQTLNNVMNTINGLRRAAGSIARMPVNIADSFSALFHGGSISKGAVVLKSSHGRKIVPAVILNSGKPWSHAGAMVIPSSIRRLTA